MGVIRGVFVPARVSKSQMLVERAGSVSKLCAVHEVLAVEPLHEKTLH